MCRPRDASCYEVGAPAVRRQCQYATAALRQHAWRRTFKKYDNRRAEIWGLMRDWLAGGAVSLDDVQRADLTGVEYGFDTAVQILLEKKSSMKASGLSSPDAADAAAALACTFAVPTMLAKPDDISGRRDAEKRRLARLNYVDDPYLRAKTGRPKHDPFAHLA